MEEIEEYDELKDYEEHNYWQEIYQIIDFICSEIDENSCLKEQIEILLDLVFCKNILLSSIIMREEIINYINIKCWDDYVKKNIKDDEYLIYHNNIKNKNIKTFNKIFPDLLGKISSKYKSENLLYYNEEKCDYEVITCDEFSSLLVDYFSKCYKLWNKPIDILKTKIDEKVFKIIKYRLNKFNNTKYINKLSKELILKINN